MGVIYLALHLGPGNAKLISIDNHDVITAVNMGRILRLVLADQNNGNLRRQPAQNLVRSIDDIPFAGYIALFKDLRFHRPLL